jgi:succinylarginine dihydrolase
VKGLSANRVLVPLIVVVALAAVYGLATYGRSVTLGAGRQVLPPRSAPATSVMRACPSLGLAGSSAADVALIAAPATPGQGQAEVSRL